MMLLIGSVIFPFFLIGTFLYIRMKYREYDLRETKKEQIEIIKKKIDSARAYFRKNYNNDFDHTVWDNISIKIDFCLKLISRRSIDDQVILLDKLFSMCYETGVRLKTNYDDVVYITAPLNNLKDDLVQYHLNYIKDSLEGL